MTYPIIFYNLVQSSHTHTKDSPLSFRSNSTWKSKYYLAHLLQSLLLLHTWHHTFYCLISIPLFNLSLFMSGMFLSCAKGTLLHLWYMKDIVLNIIFNEIQTLNIHLRWFIGYQCCGLLKLFQKSGFLPLILFFVIVLFFKKIRL